MLQQLDRAFDRLGTDVGLLAIRVIVGFNFAFHGFGKVTNLGGTADFFEGVGIPIPGVSAVLAAAAELLGGLALLAGVFLRPAVLVLAGTMLVAIVTVHLGKGYGFMGGGVEYPLTLLIVSLALGAAGPGRYAVKIGTRETGRARG